MREVWGKPPENGGRPDIDETNFDAILCRMTRPDGKSDAEAIDYFASHPPTDERARCARDAGKQPVN